MGYAESPVELALYRMEIRVGALKTSFLVSEKRSPLCLEQLSSTTRLPRVPN
jgi:hypothetical protein